MRKERIIKTRAERQREAEEWDTLTYSQKRKRALTVTNEELIEDISVTLESIGKYIRSPRCKTETIIEMTRLMDGLNQAVRECCGRILDDAKSMLEEEDLEF